MVPFPAYSTSHRLCSKVSRFQRFVQRKPLRYLSSDALPSKRDEALFAYTSGRWIYNEALRMQERYLKFNVAALKQAILSSSHAGRINEFHKFAEGGYNRIFQASLSDGRQLLARLPYPSTQPKHYTIASEVATLQFLALHEIPVPTVCRWSSNAANDVGSEYIILNKVEGIPLADIWSSLDSKERYNVIERLVKIEQTLFSLSFPASGSIYYLQDLPEHERSLSIPLNVDGHNFCIGPMAHYGWWHEERASMNIDRGPWRNPREMFKAVGEKELQWTRQFAKRRLHYEKLYREVHKFEKMSPQPHIDALRNYLRIAECLASPSNRELARPVLRHPDLQLNNIIVNKDLNIEALIDWQHATIVPLILAAGIPKHFANYGDPESEALTQPSRELPANFESFDQDEQDQIKEQHIKRLTHFLYAASTLNLNVAHYDAIFNNAVTLHQRLFKHASTPWEGDTITLEAEMISVLERWQDVVSADLTDCVTPPVSFSSGFIENVRKVHSRQQEMDIMLDQMRTALDVDVYGWVQNDGYSEAMALKQNIKEMMIAASTGEDKEIVRKAFPFDDYDEGGMNEVMPP